MWAVPADFRRFWRWHSDSLNVQNTIRKYTFYQDEAIFGKYTIMVNM